MPADTYRELEERLASLIDVAEETRGDQTDLETMKLFRQVLRADFLVTKRLYYYATGKTWASKRDQTQRWLEHG